ncbi:hydroxymethylbilane synthase [Lyticum sinuosum]|uniref:Porphobilinogen deaminase n=1 Tax=Lyticum sinuosum TaxID=1332059 RepID=A0AAE4VKN3_9RICK|nr:hydroxymethylbilane synthase [Lyticum sinuosum]MDZ5761153.1 Porphobilinogen deaminase [Lyticum sinuosum]
MEKNIIIGARSSKLAIKQAEIVIKSMRDVGFSGDVFIKQIKTLSDIISDKQLCDIGGKSLFVKEIDEQILSGDIDMAVHSLKDIPTEYHPELKINCFLPRHNPSDIFLIKSNIFELINDKDVKIMINYEKNYTDNFFEIKNSFFSIKEEFSKYCLNKIVKLINYYRPYKPFSLGTCSPRRSALLSYFLKDTKYIISPMRGNIDNRINKLIEGNLDAIILAKCGLERISAALNLKDIVPIKISPWEFIPSAGQGTIAIVTKKHTEIDNYLSNILKKINCEETYLRSIAERATLQIINGDCYTPIGCYSEFNNKEYNKNILKESKIMKIKGFLSDINYSEIIFDEVSNVVNTVEDAYNLGSELGRKLKEKIKYFKY